MDTGERLAAYLSGDLDPDERASLDARLAGDPALRARLDRIRRSDAALADLDDVDLPDGFEDRLTERLRPELDAVLGDELAARRARRGTPRWLPAVGAAAALAVVVAGGITVAGSMGGGGGDDAADEGGRDMAAEAEAGDGGSVEMDTMMAPPAGPVITDRGRTLGRDDLDGLARDPEVQAALSPDVLAGGDPAQASDRYARALGLPSATTGEAATEAEAEDLEEADDAGASETSAAGPTDLLATTDGPVSDEDRAAVGACVDVLFESAAAPVVPVYAELATDTDGEAVIVYGALAPDADGAYQQLEVWMVERESCELRHFLIQPVERNAP